MKCLNCDNEKFETKKINTAVEYAGEKFEAIVASYVCTKCREQLMDSGQMNALRQVAADEYRSKHGLLTSHQIVELRKRLGMSQREFASYLEVGEASIKRWETYYAQETAMDQHIRLKCDKSYAEQNAFDVGIRFHKSDEFSGNRTFSWEKFKNVVLILVKTCKSPLFINKALFYLDFSHFKKYKVGITGSAYAKLDYGPCPDNYRVLFQRMLDEQLIKEGSSHSLIPLVAPDLNLFDDNEKETIELIIQHTKKDGGKALYHLSHEEAAYTKSSMWQQISYHFASKLKITAGRL